MTREQMAVVLKNKGFTSVDCDRAIDLLMTMAMACRVNQMPDAAQAHWDAIALVTSWTMKMKD